MGINKRLCAAGFFGTSERRPHSPRRPITIQRASQGMVFYTRTLILRFRQVRQPVLVRRLTSFLCRPLDSILFGSPGSWYRIWSLESMFICVG